MHVHDIMFTDDPLYRQASAVPLQIATHDGTDVAIYSTGPQSHLLHTTHEQNYVFDVMTFATCLLDYGDLKCPRTAREDNAIHATQFIEPNLHRYSEHEPPYSYLALVSAGTKPISAYGSISFFTVIYCLCISFICHLL